MYTHTQGTMQNHGPAVEKSKTARVVACRKKQDTVEGISEKAYCTHIVQWGKCVGCGRHKAQETLKQMLGAC